MAQRRIARGSTLLEPFSAHLFFLNAKSSFGYTDKIFCLSHRNLQGAQPDSICPRSQPTTAALLKYLARLLPLLRFYIYFIIIHTLLQFVNTFFDFFGKLLRKRTSRFLKKAPQKLLWHWFLHTMRVIFATNNFVGLNKKISEK